MTPVRTQSNRTKVAPRLPSYSPHDAPLLSPARAQSSRRMVHTHPHLCGVRDTPLPSPALSASSLISDQPPSACDHLLTSGLELAGSNYSVQETSPGFLSPSAHRISGRCPTYYDGMPSGTSLHPDLVTISCNESRLSNSGNIISNGFRFTC